MIAVALLAPLLALPLTWRAPSTVAARRWVSWLALAVAAVWLVLLLTDERAELGRFGAGAAPVAAGTWLLVASVRWPARRWPLALTVLAAGTAAGGAALLAGAGDLSDAGGALAIAAALVVLAARAEDDRGLVPAALGVAGAAAVALGLVGLESDTGGFAAGGGALVALGAAAVVLGAGNRVRRAGVVLLPLALALGVQADVGTGVALVLAIAAVLVADRPAASLGLWALAVAALNPAAGLLLAAAAVVSAAWLHPLASLAALPGAAAFAFVALQDGSPARLALAALAAVTIARLWRPIEPDLVGGRLAPSTIAAVGVGAWLALAPETWAWAPAPGLASWGTGVLYAGLAAAFGAFVIASFTDAAFVAPDLEVADPSYRPGEPRWAWRAALAALAVLAIAGAWLVASVVS